MKKTFGIIAALLLAIPISALAENFTVRGDMGSTIRDVVAVLDRPNFLPPVRKPAHFTQVIPVQCFQRWAGGCRGQYRLRRMQRQLLRYL